MPIEQIHSIGWRGAVLDLATAVLSRSKNVDAQRPPARIPLTYELALKPADLGDEGRASTNVALKGVLKPDRIGSRL